ncbi:DUF6268 family outer membrane beta-barrel protein [Gemmatimonadota bacterium]
MNRKTFWIAQICLLVMWANLFTGYTAALYAQDNSDGAKDEQSENRSKFELFRLKNLYIPESDFAASPNGVTGSKGKFGINMLDAGLNVPTLFQQGKTAIVHSLNYQLLRFIRLESDDGIGPGSLAINRLDDLVAIEYGFFALHKLSSDRWRWMFASLHGIYSARSGGVSLNDYRLQAAVVVERTWANGAYFGLGFAYTTTLDFPILPVLTLQTHPNSAFMLKLILPLNGALTYRISRNVELGLVGSVEGNRYNLRDVQNLNSEDVSDNLRYSVGTIGPQAKLRVAGPCYLAANAGRTFRRKLEFLDGDSKIGEVELDNNWFARATFSAEF